PRVVGDHSSAQSGAGLFRTRHTIRPAGTVAAGVAAPQVGCGGAAQRSGIVYANGIPPAGRRPTRASDRVVPALAGTGPEPEHGSGESGWTAGSARRAGGSRTVASPRAGIAAPAAGIALYKSTLRDRKGMATANRC